MLPTVQNEVFWIDFVSIRRNDCCITSIPTPKFEVWQESADSWETKIKNKPALEVQRLLSTLDLITASTTLKLTISHFHIPKIYFQDTRKIK